MKLTDENQDYMDCRPPRENGIRPSDSVQKMLDEHKAKMAALKKLLDRAAE